MSSQDVECDAPPYPVVRATRRAGLTSPEDVRWCRVGHDAGLLGQWARWLWRLGRGAPGPRACRCGHPLPALASFTFTSSVTGRQAHYLLVQCPRCRTVYWDGP